MNTIQRDLRKKANPERAKASARFFKTGKGQYGFGDKFIGVSVPEQRVIAKKYIDVGFDELETLITSPVHEDRLVALIMLVEKYKKGDSLLRDKIFEFYFLHSRFVNNWDLVDTSAPILVGEFLLDKKITLLLTLAKSQKLWEKRIAIIATFAFIRAKQEKPSFLIADILLDDKEDLIQKAVGWTLREVGKNISQEVEEEYLKSRYKKMGRTALRYAIEHFDEAKRKKYLLGKI